MVTHLDPDMLEYEAEWALGSITTEKAKKKKKKKLKKKKKKLVHMMEFQLSY